MPLPNSYGINQCLGGSFPVFQLEKEPREAIGELTALDFCSYSECVNLNTKNFNYYLFLVGWNSSTRAR